MKLFGLPKLGMQDLFGKAKSTISEHNKNVFDEGELERDPTVRKFRTVQTEGRREVSRKALQWTIIARSEMP